MTTPPVPGRVLLTGGSGFVGSHVRRLLEAQGSPPRALAHRAGIDADDVVWGDLADPASLRGACEGVTTLVHTASVINGSEDACRRINEDGTAALLAEARRAGVRRIVYLSTAAVYGNGVHRGIAENAIEPAPVSPTSSSRLSAERGVLAAGGTVLRPMFVYGPGDRWFLPGIARLARGLSGRPAGGRARLSLISVDALAAAVCAVARTPPAALGTPILHVTHPEPTPTGDILDILESESLIPPRTAATGYDQAVAELGSAAARHLALVSFDHFYDSSRLWQITGASPGGGFRETYPRYAEWYRREMALGV